MTGAGKLILKKLMTGQNIPLICKWSITSATSLRDSGSGGDSDSVTLLGAILGVIESLTVGLLTCGCRRG
jgi:hypothetical protein